jgi:cytochrome oxidase Cu insertion factor (SCO1/SenC/PrrC family)
MRLIPTAAVVGAMLLGALVTNSKANGEADEKTGLKIGTKAPAFTLMDQSGKERSLNEFLEKGKVALVFYRSASW